jgi:DNA repair protein RadC
MAEALLFMTPLPLDTKNKECLTMRVTTYKTRLTTEGRAVLEKEKSVYCPEVDRQMRSPNKIVQLGRSYLRMHEETEEYLYMVCLNTKLMMTGVFEISHGSVNASVAGVREIMQKALLANAVSIILMHNHPSGDCTPSKQDIEITKRLVEAGNIVGIDVLDHIILSEKSYCSLKERGNM